MRKQKEAFLKAVWERVSTTGSLVMDSVLEVAEQQNIEVEAAAKIVKGDAELQALLLKQAIEMRQISRPVEAE